MKRAYRRGVINYETDGNITLTDFHVRYELWAVFEGWKDIPDDIRERLNAWELDHYGTQKREEIEALKVGKNVEIHDRAEYLLLHEAESLLDRVEHIYLWPCNCRTMMGRCKKSGLQLSTLYKRARHRVGDLTRTRERHHAPGSPAGIDADE